ncbi:minor coat protein [Pueraria lobata-associated crinivirus]|nr:minor coat protein [Pueraria lobata-associated crinivirus]
MDIEDFHESIDGQIVTRADKFMWCQTHSLSIQDVSELKFKFTNNSDVFSSSFLFQVKIIIPDGNLIYEYKFNSTSSHTFKQAGGRTWSNAFDLIGSPRILRLGTTNDITFNKEGRDWILTINGFRYVKIKGVYNPSEMLISLSYPANEVQIDTSSVYITDFVRFKSLFSDLSLNGSDYQPKTIRTYLLNLGNNNVINMKIGKPLEFLSVKSVNDFNIRKENNIPKPKPVPNPDFPPEKEEKSSPKPKPNPVIPPLPKPEEKKIEVVEETVKRPTPPISSVDVPIKPGNVSEVNTAIVSKIKGVERFKLYNAEIEEIFQKCVEHYMKMGFDRDQAKLIIFQMGVTFCTSKNSIGNLTYHLIWEKSDGKLIRIKKCDHLRYMNSLIRFNCNVERIVLKYYSREIFELLKTGVLKPAFHHAKKKGVKSEFAYLVTDFLDPAVLKLSDEELQALNSDQVYVMLKNKHRRSIVNVNQLR